MLLKKAPVLSFSLYLLILLIQELQYFLISFVTYGDVKRLKKAQKLLTVSVSN